jgi:hypothetical protein
MNIIVCKQKHRKCKNGLLKSTKHVFSHYYFSHMWHTYKIWKFEPNGYKKVAKLFNKGIISLVALCFKISRLWNFHVILFSSNWHNEYVVA